MQDIAKWTKHRERAHFFSVALADGTGPFNAIAGEQAGSVTLGQNIRVRGCVVVRRGQPILVVCRIAPCVRRGPQ